MNNEDQDQRRREIQEFRYALIAELSNPYLEHGELKRLIREKADREYDIPYSQRKHISEECIRNWLKKFRKYGKEGLLPKKRSDWRDCRSMSPQEASQLIQYLEEHPELTATRCLIELQRQGKIISSVSSSSLSRLVRASGMDRETRMQKKREEKSLKFDFFYPLECVQADDLFAFPVLDAKGGRRKAILMSFLDDATRRVLYANFSFTERSVQFETGIKHILKAHGRIGMVYVDHGAPFVSRQTKRILDILGIVIAHSTVRRPQGRGKKERFFRTLREQFLRPLDKESIRGLGDLNMRFRTWLESEYHRTPHRGLKGKTPLDAWLEKSRYIVHMEPSIDLEQAFLHEESRKVYKDSTLTLDGTLYEVSSCLIGKRVKIFYDPTMPVKRLQVLYEGKSHGEARIVDSYANTKVKRNATSNGSLDIQDDPPEQAAASRRPDSPKAPMSPTQRALAASRIDVPTQRGAENE
ncbi:MAG: helix-turn-helix domain-containing protein [Spirochaetia bacterium]